VDRLGSGCVRLLMDFQDFDFNLLARRTFPFCGPGFDANNSANQLGVNFSGASIANFPAERLRHVQLTIGSGPSSGSVVNDRTTVHTVPRVDANDIINGGATDLGGEGANRACLWLAGERVSREPCSSSPKRPDAPSRWR
jgi:hypothetical protein